MNGDGTMDLLTGCYEGGVYLMEGLGDGQFAEPKPMLDAEGAWIRLGAYWDQEEAVWTNVETSTFREEHGVSAVPIDWDDDGDLDLLLGATGGGVFLRRNEGTATEFSYATQSEAVEVGGEPLRAPGGGAMAITADWDRDGVWDILVGCASGEVVWYRNVGKIGEPSFAPAITLVEEFERRSTHYQPTRPGSRVQIDVGDYNGDGFPDLLVGDYQSIKPEAPELTDEEETLLAELREGSKIAYGEYAAARSKISDESSESNPEVEDLYDTYTNYRMQIGLLDPPAIRHGWIWIYERRIE
jgi:hypothetical protein